MHQSRKVDIFLIHVDNALIFVDKEALYAIIFVVFLSTALFSFFLNILGNR